MLQRSCLIVNLTLAVAAAAWADDWALPRGDVRGSGVAPGALTEVYEPAWAFRARETVKSSPVVADGVVFVGSSDAHVYAIDLHRGELRWSTPVQGAVEAPPMVHDGVVYVGTMDGVFHALDTADGGERWRYMTEDGQILSAATPATIGERPVVLFGSYDNRLHCVDARSGEQVWTYLTEGYVNSTPALAPPAAAGNEPRVVFGGCDGFLYVLNLADGALIGRTELGGEVAAMPAVADGYAIVGHYQNLVVSVDLAAHAIAWEFHDRNFPYVSAAAVQGDRVVIGSRARRVYCLQRDTGKELWHFRPRGAVDSSPVIAGERVVFGSNDGKVYLLALDSGHLLWAHDIGASITASPAVADGWIVIGAEDGGVYAFRPAAAPTEGGDHE